MGVAAVAGPAEMRRPYLSWIWIVIAYAALQAWLVGRLPLEQDELYTLLESRDLFATTLKPGIDARPLYYLLQHPLLDIAGIEPAALRLLPVTFGIVGLILTAQLAHRLTHSEWTANVALVLTVASPWFLHASSFARYWSLVYTCTVGLILYLLAAQESGRATDYLKALAFALAGSFTHPTFLFACAGYATAFIICSDSGRLRLASPSRTALTVFWIPWVAVAVCGALVLRVTGSSDTIQNFSGRGIAATLRLLPAIVQWITPSVFVAGALGILGLLRRDQSRQWGFVAGLGCLASLGLLAVAAMRTNVYADYAMPVLPLLTISAARFVAGISQKSVQARANILALTALVLAGQAPSTVSFLVDGMRFDYRPALEQARRTDSAIPVMGWPEILMRYYAPDLEHVPYRVSQRGLESAADANGMFWLVLSRREYGYPSIDADGEAWANRSCTRVNRFQRLRFDSRRYEVELLLCGAPKPGLTR